MFKQLQAELALAHNIHFNDVSLLEEALTQANYINEHPNYTGRDYQRLEFLGDAVMQQSTAVYLFKRYPDWDEGRLTELRISMVQTRAFAALSREVHLDQYVQLGRGEELSGARNRDSLLEDLWEAFIGALYLDQGQEVVMNFLSEIMFTKIDEGFYDQFVDYKSKLQEHLQRHGSVKIAYTKLSERPVENNEQIFTVEVSVNEQALATGEGKSTKEAEKAAARAAYQTLTKN
ncbi:ribonuclease III [Weissella confusa]|uniref:ribonuclease III n=1 Tax=Weissella confusa TaxID=1583 RepID=UPI0018F13DB5|nr:ribonuclease III [Weissella confusa]MBJ7618274.1 ribonuclease III [Weissella confusa]MBJ7624233.1 ribonuclease III [Weissella confusa]MBJ7651249.1 ribonuclease III [Weissella confusa]MBJ7675533.1 ribonuclease III [Weissella confusa]